MEESLEEPGKVQMAYKAPTADLLRLPIEIRLEIHYYCIPRKHVVDVDAYNVHEPRFHFERSFSDNSSVSEDETDRESDSELEDHVR